MIYIYQDMKLVSKFSKGMEILDFIYRFKFKRDKMYPRTAIFDITYDCNLRCKMCWRSVQDSLDNNFSGKVLEFGKIRELIDILKSKGLKKIMIAGGDPFMYKDIKEVTKYIKEKGLSGTIITNAVLMNEEMGKHLVEIGWDELAVSIDGYDEETHDFIRGRGVFDKATKNIRRLNELKEEMNSKRPKLGMHSIVFDHTSTNLENSVRLAHELGMAYVGYTRLLPWSPNYKKLKLKEGNTEVAKKSMTRAHELGKELNIHTNAKDFFEERHPDFCYFIYDTIFFNPSGEAMLCCRMPKVFGNALEQGLDEVWFGEEIEKLRRAFDENKIPEICKTCNLSNIKQSNRIKKVLDKTPF